MREQELQVGLGRQIAKFRKAAGLTQEELGAKVGLNWKTVGKIERGLSFTSLGTLYQIGVALNRNLDELFAWAPKRKLKADEEAVETAIALIRDVAASEQAFSLDDAVKLLGLLTKKKARTGRAGAKN